VADTATVSAASYDATITAASSYAAAVITTAGATGIVCAATRERCHCQ